MDQPLGDDIFEEGTPFKVWLGWVVTVVFAVLGALAGAYVGWTIDDGMMTVMCACAGFCIAFVLSCVTCGPFMYYFHKAVAATAPPEMSRVQAMWQGGHTSFDLFVTVHRVSNVYSTEGIAGFFGSRNNSYVDVKVGRLLNDNFSIQMNPPKKTCVSTENVFEECFHFCVALTDDHIRFSLYDQDVFSDDYVGHVDVNITNEVLLGGFPQRKSYQLKRDAGDDPGYRVRAIAGNVIVSFTPAHDYRNPKIQGERPLNFQQVDITKKKLLKFTTKTQYGTWLESQVLGTSGKLDTTQQQ